MAGLPSRFTGAPPLRGPRSRHGPRWRAKGLRYLPAVSWPLHNVGLVAVTPRGRLGGDRLALRDDDRASTCSARRALRAAAGWPAARGVAFGDRVALLLGNRSAYLELVLATARLGRRRRSTRASPRPRSARAARRAGPTSSTRRAGRSRTPPGGGHAARGPCGSRSAGRCRRVRGGARPLRPRREVEPVSPQQPNNPNVHVGDDGHARGTLLPHRKAFLQRAQRAALLRALRPRAAWFFSGRCDAVPRALRGARRPRPLRRLAPALPLHRGRRPRCRWT